jgi:hypothetical protein
MTHGAKFLVTRFETARYEHRTSMGIPEPFWAGASPDSGTSWDSTLSDSRTAASHHRPELVSPSAFLSDLTVAAELQAEYEWSAVFAGETIDPGRLVTVDRAAGFSRDKSTE